MAKFATNVSGAMFLPSLIQVMESISGFVVPLAMFYYHEFWALKLNQHGTNMVGSTLIQFQALVPKIVAVSLFLDTFITFFIPTCFITLCLLGN